MELMSIDIALAEYENYEEFLGDFPMFKGCKGAEEEYNNIILYYRGLLLINHLERCEH
jgi:hypothetical protein